MAGLIDHIREFKQRIANSGGGNQPPAATNTGPSLGDVNKLINASQKALVGAMKTNPRFLTGKMTGTGKK